MGAGPRGHCKLLQWPSLLTRLGHWRRANTNSATCCWQPGRSSALWALLTCGPGTSTCVRLRRLCRSLSSSDATTCVDLFGFHLKSAGGCHHSQCLNHLTFWWQVDTRCLRDQGRLGASHDFRSDAPHVRPSLHLPSRKPSRRQASQERHCFRNAGFAGCRTLSGLLNLPC